jgi:hypothetical protein
MDTHDNARLTPRGREEMVRGVVDGARPCVRVATNHSENGAKCVRRFREYGVDGLRDRS